MNSLIICGSTYCYRLIFNLEHPRKHGFILSVSDIFPLPEQGKQCFFLFLLMLSPISDLGLIYSSEIPALNVFYRFQDIQSRA